MKKLYLFLLLLCGAGAIQAQVTQIQMPLPTYTGPYSTQTRGYWFTAPTCFTITGLRVPTDASTSAQSIAVMRFPSTPPVWSTTTNNFDLLHLSQSVSGTNIINVNIQVEAGDFIGILGVRGNTNAYASGPFTTTIAGQSVTLTRMGFQDQLQNLAPYDVWQQGGSSISRVEMYYDTLLTHTVSTNISSNTVDFTISSASSFTIVWDFGDGSALATSYAPTHTYIPGIYTACAYVATSCGIDTVCTQISLCAPPVTNFGFSATGLSVAFSDSSQGATQWWMWDFGDGNTDTTANPNHSYTTSGLYTVCLVTQSACGAFDTLCTQVLACVDPSAQFTSSYISPDSVAFSDGSTQASSWFWDFGDGNTDTVASPTHVYTTSGQYTVCLIVTNLCGSDTTCMTQNICLVPPVASFTSSTNELVATFTDGSSNAASWSWDFGDGNTSTMQNPTHTYGANGDFVVCLSVTDLCGNSVTQCDTLTICASPSTSFSLSLGGNGGEATFSDMSTLATSWSWDFGDGNTSTMQNPVHNYDSSGNYIVCLTASNSCGSDTFCLAIVVTVVGLEDVLPGAQLQIFPNPAHDFANIQILAPGQSGSYRISLFDMPGRQLLQREGNFNERLRIPTSGLSKGVYFYRIEYKDKAVAVGRLAVE